MEKGTKKEKKEPVVRLNCKLEDIINSRGIKVSWLADKSGVSRNTIHTYMKKDDNDVSYPIPSLDRAYAISEVLGLNVYDIWTKKDAD